MKKIVLTGGGTAGHVTPNIALIGQLKELGYEVHYIGQRWGIEEQLIRELPRELGVTFHKISAGKLRRQKSVEAMFKNFTDIFKVMTGIFEARTALSAIEPDVVFSKGGFVSVPVILASKLAGVPVVIHESDITPGLTNRISLPMAENICVSFEETGEYIKKHYKKDCVITGTPVRKEILMGDRNKGRKLCHFADDSKPKLLVMGGSQGSVFINGVIRSCLKIGKFDDFNIIHITGPNNIDNSIKADNYLQFDYLKKEISDVLAISDLVISRAGANSIFEMLVLNKPHLLIPLSRKVSRGDQIENAKAFLKEGYSSVLYEDEVTVETLSAAINELYENRKQYTDTMKNSNKNDAVERIIGVIGASYK